MRSHCSRKGPDPMWLVSLLEEDKLQKQPPCSNRVRDRGEAQVQGVIQLHVEKCQELPATSRHWKRQGRILPRVSEGVQHLHLGLLASRDLRGQICVVLSHRVCGTLLRYPQHMDTLSYLSPPSRGEKKLSHLSDGYEHVGHDFKSCSYNHVTSCVCEQRQEGNI